MDNGIKMLGVSHVGMNLLAWMAGVHVVWFYDLKGSSKMDKVDNTCYL